MHTKPSDTVTSQQQHHSDLAKIAIIGCGYVGTALARYWYQQQGHSVTATTTRQERVTELEEVATKVVVMKGKDSQAMRSLVQNQDTIILSIAPISDRQGLERIIWDDTKPSYRFLNARVSNQKIKAAGYKLIHPDTII